MNVINKQDTDGTKGLLIKGEFGYDDYATNKDKGRVWVGDGTQNIPLQKADRYVSLSGVNLDLSTGSVFTKTISGTTTFTLSNVPLGNSIVPSFILELTNAGAYTVNFWSGIKWSFGIAPSFTVSGTDVVGFYTTNNGTTWRGMILSKDSK